MNEQRKKYLQNEITFAEEQITSIIHELIQKINKTTDLNFYRLEKCLD
jgi:hypothetical protein